MSGATIVVDKLTKRFGPIHAVTDLSFSAQPGRVTGFLGPNGAGKSTTMRALLGLVTPTSGQASIGGTTYADIARPATVVGAHMATAFHPGRTARDHLWSYAPLLGVDRKRCAEALDEVGLHDSANRRVGGFSMGMKQRLGLATALLGKPQVLVLDESANGLDPAGVRWLRGFLRDFAAQGGTVLLSSHMLSEVQQSVDDVVIIAAGELKYSGTLEDLKKQASPGARVKGPDLDRLGTWAEQMWPGHAGSGGHRDIVVRGTSATEVGAAAFAAGIEVHHLSDTGEDLESVFLRLTDTTQEESA